MQHCGETPAAAPLRVQLCGVLTAPFYDASVFCSAAVPVYSCSARELRRAGW